MSVPLPTEGSTSTIAGQAPQRVTATLRLQFNSAFTLYDAIPLIPYFSQLGISHLYVSPLLAARPGSAHGYDVVDASRINSELGGETALEQLVIELRRHDMGLIVDIVPNHMAVVGGHNPWWIDVLTWGKLSDYARFFDINWHTPDPATRGKILAPFLRQDYGSALDGGEIRLHYLPSSSPSSSAPSAAEFFVGHHEHRFPISPTTYGLILAEAQGAEIRELANAFNDLADLSSPQVYQSLRQKLRTLTVADNHHRDIEHCVQRFQPDTEQGRERLHRLLQRQHYRLANWRSAADDINWRRFFDVNELAAIRVEDPLVFEAVHAKMFDLVQRGWVDGFRIDHIDGLANPRAYCRKLRRRVDGLLPSRPSGGSPTAHFPIYVEKILAYDERLPADWNVCGTTGYDFMNQVSLLLHDPSGEQPLSDLWQQVSGRSADFRTESYHARRFMLTSSFAGDLESLTDDVRTLACETPGTRDLSRGSLRRALTELIAHFPVYRGYASAGSRSAEDERFFRDAFENAARSLAPMDWPALEQLDAWLGGSPLQKLTPGAQRTLRQRILTRFHQLTSPTAAKGVEDTAFYRAGMLLSRYDVGFNAEQFSAAIELFQAQCDYRAAQQPTAMLATATHDNKRGEDIRARLAILSECSTWFAQQLREWLAMASPLCRNVPDGSAPTPGDQSILLQTLLGSWPFTDCDPDALPDSYRHRLSQWQPKALREAKLATHWWTRNEPYETACDEFLAQLLEDPHYRELRQSIYQAVDTIAAAGALNSLTQCLLRMTTPGVPDLYQGADLWDLALVDPDNRRAVDFATRQQLSSQSASLPQLLATWRDGAIKQRLIQRTLQARQKDPALWLDGEYRALPVAGTRAASMLAFVRSSATSNALVLVPIRCAALLGVPDAPLTTPMVPPQRWGDTYIVLPDSLRNRTIRSIFCGTRFLCASGTLLIKDLLARFPVNVYLTNTVTGDTS